MGETVYTSRVDVRTEEGLLRSAHVPARREPVRFGVHGEIAAFYGLAPGTYEPATTTLDYIVASTAGCLTLAFAGALSAGGVDAGPGRLRTTARGAVENDDGVLVLKRIDVAYELDAPAAQREAVERAHAGHLPQCAVYRSLRGAIEIRTHVHISPPTAATDRRTDVRAPDST